MATTQRILEAPDFEYAISGFAEDEVTDWMDFGGVPDRCLHIWGTWGATTVTIQGVNDKAGTPINLTDYLGTSISLMADAMVVIQENARYVRLKSTGGAGAVLSARILGNKNR